MMRLVLVVALFAGCTINKRTECSTQADCNDQLGAGFTCSGEGQCVFNGTPPGDGPGPDPDAAPKPDAFICPSQCTSCRLDELICRVDCGASPATCNSPINCPAGFNCEITCSTNGGCQNINCTNAASCDINCKGGGTCRNVLCGEGPCDLICDGGNSCRDIDCKDSCACNVDCNAIGSCAFEVSCPGNTIGQCSTINPRGCTSERDGCNTCAM